MNRLDRQSGSVLATVIVLAIIVVLLLMWQAGMFGGTDSQDNSSPAQATQATNQANDTSASNPANVMAGQPDDAAPIPDRELTPGELAAQKAQSYRSENGSQTDSEALEFTAANKGADSSSQAAAIDNATAQLLTKHAPDFSNCRSQGDAIEALECAAGAQTLSLKAAFESHNDLRAQGDPISLQHGSDIMQRVIEGMQTALEPFVEAADRP